MNNAKNGKSHAENYRAVKDAILYDELTQRAAAKACGVSKWFVREVATKDQEIQTFYNSGKKPPLGFADYPDEQGFAQSGQKLIRGKEEKRVNANEKIIEFKTENSITTLEQLMAICKVDLNVWYVDHYVCNSWEVGAKNASLELEKTPLFQVKAWLKRKVPQVVNFPPIKSVSFKIPKCVKFQEKRKGPFKRAFIIPDSQIGFFKHYDSLTLNPLHDRRCWHIALQILEKEKFDKIILLGDMLDLTEWTEKYSVTEEFRGMTQSSFYEIGWYLATIRSMQPQAEIYYLEGNHEVRLLKYLVNNAKQAYDLRTIHDDIPAVSIPNYLELDYYNIKYVGDYPDGIVWINDNLSCEHGNIIRQKSGKTAAAEVDNVRNSKIIGHTHRIESASKTVYARNKSITYSVYSAGTFARLDGVVPGVKARQNWQQAFMTVDYQDGNSVFDAQVHSINNGFALYKGLLIKGDHKKMQEEVYKATKWQLFKY